MRTILMWLTLTMVLGCSANVQKFGNLKLAERKYAKAAVLDLMNPQNNQTALGKYFADQITIDLAGMGLSFFDRSKVSRILNEQALSLESENFAEKLGGLLGADLLFMGNYYALENHFDVNVKAIDVKTGRIIDMEKFTYLQNPSLEALEHVLLPKIVREQNTSAKFTTQEEGGVKWAVMAEKSIPVYSGDSLIFGDSIVRVAMGQCIWNNVSVFCPISVVSLRDGKFRYVEDGKRVILGSGVDGRFQLWPSLNLESKIPMKSGVTIYVDGKPESKLSLVRFSFGFDDNEYKIELRDVKVK